MAVSRTPSGTIVKSCQVCSGRDLEPVLFLGYVPPPSAVEVCGEPLREQTRYPLQLLYCPQCHLVQLGFIVDPRIVFPPEFPYTSSTTKALRENFAALYRECRTVVGLEAQDLVVDIGSNDGNLLSNFKGHRVLGVTPEEIGRLAIERGIPTIIAFFTRQVAEQIRQEAGQAKVVTATNVFAHIQDVHEVIACILEILLPDGVFVSESHYLPRLLEKLQYDTIYHEHLRYYSLHSLKYLLEMHGLEIFHAGEIPTHGGSIRVYASRKGCRPVQGSVGALLEAEAGYGLGKTELLQFKKRVALSKLALHALLLSVAAEGKRIYGVGAAARASTLINYAGMDDSVLDCVVEVKGSHKIGNYIPGTVIPVVEESRLFEDQPEYALLLSWHLAEDLAPKLRNLGFRGDFIVPLPDPRVLS
ncbi:MAG: class I SAM-dependent methyltransferase [Acidobacteria bacterium]|nr:class I SAM-dependent methyltransferase [Acidobacteriota bacterium]